MKTVRAFQMVCVAVVLCAYHTTGQTMTNAPVAPNAPPTAIEDDTKKWSFSASAYTYLVPDDRDYVQPTITADRNWLHLEARYNYEALDTGSAWVGYNFSGGKKFAWAVTPMLGGVFGDTTGIAPGYKGSLGWWKLKLYSEGEYVFDTRESSDSFFYTWSELSVSLTDWFRVGLAAQRTKLYHTDLDIQRGLLVGFSYKKVDFTTYVFNLGWTDPTVVVAVGVGF
jgi:hypothetical protein